MSQIVFLSAEKIEGSNDLLTKILLLLPAKPLFRFNLVSKRWLSLISDRRFSSLWRPQAFPNALLLKSSSCIPELHYIPLEDKVNFEASLSFLDFIKGGNTDSIQVLNSCGGLILCCKWFRKYIVCNPTTKEFNALPTPNMNSLHMSLAFDHTVSPHYKVINVLHCLYIEIYSSDSNSWRRSRAQFSKELERYLENGTGVFFNGAIFWMFRRLNSFYYFDIDREILHSHPMPKMDEQYYCGCVNGNLHLVGSSVSERHHFNSFVLGNDYSSWSLKYCIDLYEPTPRAFRKMLYRARCPGYYAFLEFTFYVLYLPSIEGNQESYLTLYMPREGRFLRMKDRTCIKLPLPAVIHYLIENPFWIGSKISTYQ